MIVAKLSAAAASFNLKLNERSFVTASAEGNTVEGALIKGYELVPASKYHDGVDVAILRYQSKKLGIPDAYYKFTTRALSKIQDAGKHKVLSELVDETGKVAHSWKSTVDVTSVELPKDKKMSDASAVIELAAVYESTKSDGYEFLGWRVPVCCDNGVCGECICPTPSCPTS